MMRRLSAKFASGLVIFTCTVLNSAFADNKIIVQSTTSTKNSGLYDYILPLIKQDILNHFNIRQGEKLENPRFGTIIWDILYEPLTEEVKQLIIQNVTEIINYDPRVSVDGITIDSFESGIQIECVLKYLPYSISETLRLRFDQNLGLL